MEQNSSSNKLQQVCIVVLTGTVMVLNFGIAHALGRMQATLDSIHTVLVTTRTIESEQRDAANCLAWKEDHCDH